MFVHFLFIQLIAFFFVQFFCIDYVIYVVVALNLNKITIPMHQKIRMYTFILELFDIHCALFRRFQQ